MGLHDDITTEPSGFQLPVVIVHHIRKSGQRHPSASPTRNGTSLQHIDDIMRAMQRIISAIPCESPCAPFVAVSIPIGCDHQSPITRQDDGRQVVRQGIMHVPRKLGIPQQPLHPFPVGMEKHALLMLLRCNTALAQTMPRQRAEQQEHHGREIRNDICALIPHNQIRTGHSDEQRIRGDPCPQFEEQHPDGQPHTGGQAQNGLRLRKRRSQHQPKRQRIQARCDGAPHDKAQCRALQRPCRGIHQIHAARKHRIRVQATGRQRKSRIAQCRVPAHALPESPLRCLCLVHFRSAAFLRASGTTPCRVLPFAAPSGFHPMLAPLRHKLNPVPGV